MANPSVSAIMIAAVMRPIPLIVQMFCILSCRSTLAFTTAEIYCSISFSCSSKSLILALSLFCFYLFAYVGDGIEKKKKKKGRRRHTLVAGVVPRLKGKRWWMGICRFYLYHETSMLLVARAAGSAGRYLL